MSIEDSGKDLLDIAGIEAANYGFESRTRIMMLIKTLCSDEMRLGKKRMQTG